MEVKIKLNNFRFYKSTTDKKISGVCGGLAEVLGIDPSIIRIVWVLIALFYGFGIILYIVAALILPEGPPEGHTNYKKSSYENDSSKKEYSSREKKEKKENSSEEEKDDVDYREIKSYDDIK